MHNDNSVAEKLDRLTVQPCMGDDLVETVSASTIEGNYRILGCAIDRAVGSESQSAGAAKRHAGPRRKYAHQRPAASVVFSNRCVRFGRTEPKLARHEHVATRTDREIQRAHCVVDCKLVVFERATHRQLKNRICTQPIRPHTRRKGSLTSIGAYGPLLATERVRLSCQSAQA